MTTDRLRRRILPLITQCSVIVLVTAFSLLANGCRASASATEPQFTASEDHRGFLVIAEDGSLWTAGPVDDWAEFDFRGVIHED